MNGISVKFVDFWRGFNAFDNVFVSALRSRFDVSVISDDDTTTVPDILFYSYFGTKHLQYDCLKVYYTGENDVPDLNECDYAISFHDITFGDKCLRYPLYMMYEYENAIDGPAHSPSDARRPFCSLLMRNTQWCDPHRLDIIDAVDAYRPLAYGGPFRNNTGGPIADKVEFIAGYKFNLALENSIVDGYVTEKLIEPLSAGTVPIYWGSNAALKDVNPDSFMNVSDYDTIESFIDDLAAVDNDDVRYMKMQTAPGLRRDAVTDYSDRLATFLCNIASGRRRYVSRYGGVFKLHDHQLITAHLCDTKWRRRATKLYSKLFKR